MPDSRPFKISYSGLSAYQQCPLKYKYVYIDRLPTKPAPALFFGSTIHKCLEYLHRPEEGPGTPRTLAHLLDFLDQNWSPPSEFDGETLKKEHYDQDRAELLLTEYFMENVGYDADAGRTREPCRALAVEKYFKVDLDGDVVSGLIDRVDKIKETGGYEVIDYKTNKKEPPSYHYERDLQLPIYKWAAEEALNLKPVEKVSFFYVVPEINRKVTPGVTYDIENTKEKIRTIIAEVKQDIAEKSFQAKTGPLCPWCDFQDSCPKYGKSAG